MKIAVLVSEVIDHSVQLIFDAKRKELWEKSLYKRINRKDLIALEVALSLKNSVGATVVSITLGTERSLDNVKNVVAPRVDRAVLVTEDDFILKKADAYYAAHILSMYLKKGKWDLIFCGTETSDFGGGVTGALVAKYLGIPFVWGAVDVAGIDERMKVVSVKRKREWGRREVIEVPMPIAIAFDEGEVEPQIPPLSVRLGTTGGSLELIKSDELRSFSTALRGNVSMDVHKVKPRGIFVPDSNLSPLERVKALMSGGLEKKKGEVIKEGGGNAVNAIVEFLKEIGVI